jgi:hypothetical protein
MGSVYSKRFLGAHAATASISASCPAGKVWVVKAVDLVMGSATGSAGVQVNGIYVCFISRSSQPSSNQMQDDQYRGMAVVNPGELLQLFVTAGIWDVQASGYELTL